MSNTVKLSHAGFRERAFALTLWKKGDVAMGVSFFPFTEQARYDSSLDEIQYKDLSFKVRDVDVSVQELEDAED